MESLENIFIENPRYSPLKDLARIEELYSSMYEDRAIDHMKWASDDGRPAICGIIKKLESSFHDKSADAKGMNFQKNIHLKQFIGFLVSHLMASAGYKKLKNRNIAKDESDFFRAGALFRKMRDIAQERLKGQEFFKKYNLGEKILAIMKDLSNFEFECSEDNSMWSYKNIKNSSMDFLVEIGKRWKMLNKFNDSRPLFMNLFVTPFQIAIELERRNPGIMALSGLNSFENTDADETYNFFSMINEEFSVFSKERRIKIERGRLSYSFAPQASYYFDNGEASTYLASVDGNAKDSDDEYTEFYTEPFEFMRLKTTLFNVKEVMQSVYSKIDYSWEKNVFDSMGLSHKIHDILNKENGNSDRHLPTYMSSQQLGLEIAETRGLIDLISSPQLIAKELVRRILMEEINEIEMAALSGFHTTSLTFNNGEITGIGNIIPLFRIKK